jgi:hypothetical protein
MFYLCTADSFCEPSSNVLRVINSNKMRCGHTVRKEETRDGRKILVSDIR